MKSSIILAVFALLCSADASAQHVRKAKGHQQVQQGVRCGTITPRERMAIARQQQDVRLAVRVAQSDGIITPAERRIIFHEKQQVNTAIYRTKHNNRMR